jgi:hypothetical protein
MARSRRRRVNLTAPEALAEALPERFLCPTLGDNPVGALQAYITALSEWVVEQGVPIGSARFVASEVMALVGAAPSDWYRVAFERPC